MSKGKKKKKKRSQQEKSQPQKEPIFSASSENPNASFETYRKAQTNVDKCVDQVMKVECRMDDLHERLEELQAEAREAEGQ